MSAQRIARIVGETLAWGWFLLAGCGGFGLILSEGALPLTHGWYAMFSGIAASPWLAWLAKRYAHIELPFWARFGAAALLIALGRLALIVRVWPFG